MSVTIAGPRFSIRSSAEEANHTSGAPPRTSIVHRLAVGLAAALVALPAALALSAGITHAQTVAPDVDDAPPREPAPPLEPADPMRDREAVGNGGDAPAPPTGVAVAPQSANPPQPAGYFYGAADLTRPFRGLTITMGLGPGGLFGPADSGLPAVHDFALAHTFRLSIGLTQDLALTFANEGAGTRSTATTGASSWLRQTQWLLGLQYFVNHRGYLRASAGVGYLTERAGSQAVGSGTGFATGVALGWELFQTDHLAFAVELRGTTTIVSHELWGMVGTNLTFSFF